MAPISFSGRETFNAEPAKVYAALTDLEAFKDTIPDVQEARVVDARTLEATVRPGFSFLRGTLRMKMTLDQTTPGRDATMRVNADGVGTGLTIESKVSVAPEGTGSAIDWRADVVELRGLIKAVGPTLIKAAADKVVKDGFAKLRARVETPG